MANNKEIFDDSIRATYEIAITKLAKEGIDPNLKY